MWGQIIGSVVGLVGLAVTTNLFLGWQAKSRRTLREEAELLEHIPVDVAERAMFAAYVGEGLSLYVNRSRDAGTSDMRLKRRARIARAIGLAGVGGFAASLVAWGVTGKLLFDPTEWPFWLGSVSLLVEFAGVQWFTALKRQIARRDLEHSVEDALGIADDVAVEVTRKNESSAASESDA